MHSSRMRTVDVDVRGGRPPWTETPDPLPDTLDRAPTWTETPLPPARTERPPSHHEQSNMSKNITFRQLPVGGSNGLVRPSSGKILDPPLL